MKLVKRILDIIYKNNPVSYAKRIGVHIGKKVKLVDNPNWGSEPYLISIGDETLVSGQVAFVTHDMSIRVIKKINANDAELNKCHKYGKIVVGNNCFIGMRSTILPGVVIGDNSIIAAGSMVTKSIPCNQVWGGTS